MTGDAGVEEGLAAAGSAPERQGVRVSVDLQDPEPGSGIY